MACPGTGRRDTHIVERRTHAKDVAASFSPTKQNRPGAHDACGATILARHDEAFITIVSGATVCPIAPMAAHNRGGGRDTDDVRDVCDARRCSTRGVSLQQKSLLARFGFSFLLHLI